IWLASRTTEPRIAEGETETRQVQNRAPHLERAGRRGLPGARHDPGHAGRTEGAARERHERILPGRLQARSPARAEARASEHHADPRRVLHRRSFRDLDAARRAVADAADAAPDGDGNRAA